MNKASVVKSGAARAIPVSQIHEEWLGERRKGIGGSDAGAILGLNPYKSAYTLWGEKIGMIPDEVPDNEAMRLGRDMEQYVAERFSEATGKKVQRSGYSFESTANPFMRANVDRFLVSENAGLECKTANALTHTDYEGGDIPPSYYAQCYHYMAVTGADAWYIAILVMGKGFYWHRIERDEGEIQALVESEKEFWQLVQDRKPPVLDGSDSTKETLIYKDQPLEDETNVRDLDDIAELLEERESAAKQEKTAADYKKLLDNKIREAMGPYQKGRFDRYSVTYKPRRSSSVDKELLKEAYPDAYRNCVKETQNRVLLIRKVKPKKGAKA